MKIEIEIPEDRIIDLLSAALESSPGSGYWASTPYGLPFDEERRFRSVMIADNEADGGREVWLTMAKIKRGMALFPREAPHRFARFMSDQEDSIDGDVFLQLCLFGKVLYG